MTDPAQRLAELAEEVRKQRLATGDDGASHAPARPDNGGTRPQRAAGSRTRGARRGLARWGRRILIAAVALVLPFVVLLRSATWLYATGRLGTWAAVSAGAGLTFLLLAAYVLGVARWIRRRFGGAERSVDVRVAGGPATEASPRRRATKRLLQGTGVLVLTYCAYGLVFLGAGNAKSDAVRQEYRSLHPVLRMAVGTLVLVDGDLLVTDAARDLDDYAAMGLPPNETSLHLEQADGYAHALDLRTAGRPAPVNWLVRAYFEAMGFRTLRHVGTADHLHVSLPLPAPAPSSPGSP